MWTRDRLLRQKQKWQKFIDAFIQFHWVLGVGAEPQYGSGGHLWRHVVYGVQYLRLNYGYEDPSHEVILIDVSFVYNFLI